MKVLFLISATDSREAVDSWMFSGGISFREGSVLLFDRDNVFSCKRAQKEAADADLVVVLTSRLAGLSFLRDRYGNGPAPFPHTDSKLFAGDPAFELECMLRLQRVVECARQIRELRGD
jgi:hypothetical protein